MDGMLLFIFDIIKGYKCAIINAIDFYLIRKLRSAEIL